MAVYPAHGLSIAIAMVAESLDYKPLKQIFVRSFSIHSEDEMTRRIAPQAWQEHSAVVRQYAELDIEMALDDNAAHGLLRHAAFHGDGLMIRVTFPDEASIGGVYNVSRYEWFAETGDAIRIAIRAHSREALLHILEG